MHLALGFVTWMAVDDSSYTYRGPMFAATGSGMVASEVVQGVNESPITHHEDNPNLRS